jgi:uncharacterized protein YndB with AHSA1/START domain
MTFHGNDTVHTEEDYGTLDRDGGHPVVRFRRQLHHPPAKVWRALTEPEHLAPWFPTTIEGERVTGARLRFGFRQMEIDAFDGEMLAFDPPTLMELRWGDQTLRFELQPTDDGSVLTFTATFDEIGKVARDGAGWHACLDLLTFDIDGASAPWTSADRWRQVSPTYVARFGPEASTVGPPEGWDSVN